VLNSLNNHVHNTTIMESSDKSTALPSGQDGSTKTEDVADGTSYIQWFIDEMTGSPINIVLLIAILYLIYKILKPETEDGDVVVEEKLAPMKKQDMTPAQLREYDGLRREDGRVLIAVLGKIFDVTKSKNFYGPGGPYSAFAGKDASRGLATFNVGLACEEYDDLSDLNKSELDQVREWSEQFTEKYPIIGKLLKPDETPTVYTDDEEDVDEKQIQEENKAIVGGRTTT